MKKDKVINKVIEDLLDSGNLDPTLNEIAMLAGCTILEVADFLKRNKSLTKVQQALKAVKIAQLEQSNQVIDLLKKSLMSEFRQWDLYYNYKEQLKGLTRTEIAKHFEEHAADEAKHIEILQRYLTTLGGSSPTERHPIPSLTNPSCEEIIALQLKFELEAVSNYEKFLEALGEQNPPLRIEIENILITEKEHAQDFILLLETTEQKMTKTQQALLAIKKIAVNHCMNCGYGFMGRERAPRGDGTIPVTKGPYDPSKECPSCGVPGPTASLGQKNKPEAKSFGEKWFVDYEDQSDLGYIGPFFEKATAEEMAKEILSIEEEERKYTGLDYSTEIPEVINERQKIERSHKRNLHHKDLAREIGLKDSELPESTITSPSDARKMLKNTVEFFKKRYYDEKRKDIPITQIDPNDLDGFPTIKVQQALRAVKFAQEKITEPVKAPQPGQKPTEKPVEKKYPFDIEKAKKATPQYIGSMNLNNYKTQLKQILKTNAEMNTNEWFEAVYNYQKQNPETIYADGIIGPLTFKTMTNKNPQMFQKQEVEKIHQTLQSTVSDPKSLWGSELLQHAKQKGLVSLQSVAPIKDYPYAHPDIKKLLEYLVNGGVKIQAITEAYPPTVRHGDPNHLSGRAIDVALKNPMTAHEVSKLINSMPGFKALDEYNNPSSRSTGGHLHITMTQKERIV